MISITAINAAVQSIVGIGKITSDIKNGISNKDKGTDLLIQFDTMKDEKKNGQGYIVMTVFNVSQSTIVERLNISLNGHELVNDKVIPCGNFSSFKILSYTYRLMNHSYPIIAGVDCNGEFDYDNQITINDSGEAVFTLEVNDEQYEMSVDLYKILRLK